MNGNFGGSIMCRKGTIIPQIIIYSIQDKALTFPWWKWSYATRSLTGNLKDGCLVGGSVLLSLLTDLVLSSIYSQVIFGKWTSMLLSLFITSISATMTILFMCPLNNDRDSQAKNLLLSIHRMGHPIYLIIGLLPSFSEHLTWGTSIFTSAAHCEISRYVPSSRMAFSPFFQSYCFQVPNHPVKQLATAHKSVLNHISAHTSF